MSDNVGLSTPRGSGTSGYVQRNLAHLKLRDHVAPWTLRDREADLQKHRQRQPNKSILEHDRKREVEVKVFELRDELEEQGLDEQEIDAQCNALRSKLRTELDIALARSNNSGGAMPPSQSQQRRNLKTHQVHELAEAKIQESERLRRALKISKDYEEGSHWRRQEERLKKSGFTAATNIFEPSGPTTLNTPDEPPLPVNRLEDGERNINKARRTTQRRRDSYSDNYSDNSDEYGHRSSSDRHHRFSTRARGDRNRRYGGDLRRFDRNVEPTSFMKKEREYRQRDDSRNRGRRLHSRRSRSPIRSLSSSSRQRSRSRKREESMGNQDSWYGDRNNQVSRLSRSRSRSRSRSMTRSVSHVSSLDRRRYPRREYRGRGASADSFDSRSRSRSRSRSCMSKGSSRGRSLSRSPPRRYRRRDESYYSETPSDNGKRYGYSKGENSNSRGRSFSRDRSPSSHPAPRRYRKRADSCEDRATSSESGRYGHRNNSRDPSRSRSRSRNEGWSMARRYARGNGERGGRMTRSRNVDSWIRDRDISGEKRS